MAIEPGKEPTGLSGFITPVIVDATPAGQIISFSMELCAKIGVQLRKLVALRGPCKMAVKGKISDIRVLFKKGAIA